MNALHFPLILRGLPLLGCLLASPVWAKAQSVASFSTTNTTLTPGKTYTFTYGLTGSVSGGFSAPQIVTIFQMTPAAVPTLSGEQRLGSQTVSAVGSSGNWSAPPGPFPISLTMPTSLEGSVWPANIRSKGCIPPGNYYIYAFVNSTYKTLSITVLPITLSSVSPASARVGESVQINGTFPNTPTEVWINGAKVLTSDWSYSATAQRITAKVPTTASATGKIEVRTALETAVSSFGFQVLLPDLATVKPVSWAGSVVTSRQIKQTSPGELYEGIPYYLSFGVGNRGTDACPTALSLISVDGAGVTYTGSPALATGASDQVSDLLLPALKAGTHTLTIQHDFINAVREADETNNTTTVNLSVSAHPADVYKSQHFSAQDLADASKEPTIWGDAADPDGDGLPNLCEYFCGTNPVVSDASPDRNLAFVATQTGWVVYHLRATTPPSGVTMSFEGSQNLQTWTPLVLNTGYTDTVLSDPSGSVREIKVKTSVAPFVRIRYTRN